MPIELTGGCRVSRIREEAARDLGTVRVWQHAGRESGAAAISLCVLEVGPGRSPRLGGAACDEVLYVFEGAGALLFEGGSRPIGTDTGFYILHHYHEYEEVLCILQGRGRMWAGDRSTPIERGSCVYLPRRQMHCVENTGDSELRLLGVFYPSGSPAVRYYDSNG